MKVIVVQGPSWSRLPAEEAAWCSFEFTFRSGHMHAEDKAFLTELLNTPSPTGFEGPGQRVWAKKVKEHADSVESDAYGTVWATVRGSGGPTLMLEAHADEIGFMVKYITDEGFIHIDRIGGSDHAIARGKRIRIFGAEGPVLGVIGNTAIHLRDRSGEEKAPKLEELFVDIGASSKEDVTARGVRVGHPAVYTDSIEELTENRLIGRALDNRLGGYVIAKVMENLATKRPVSTVHAVNAVQEEIGGGGARMVAYRLEPDAALVLDVTHATDSPGIKMAKHGAVVLGAGPSVTHGTANHPAVVQRLVEVAEQEGIAIQHESSSRYSGTDTDQIFATRRGVPSALISIPMRYMHSTIEMVDLADVESTVALMTAFVRSVAAEDGFQAQVFQG